MLQSPRCAINMGLVVRPTQLDDVSTGVSKRLLLLLLEKDERQRRTIWGILTKQFLKCVMNMELVFITTQIDDIRDGASKRPLPPLLKRDKRK